MIWGYGQVAHGPGVRLDGSWSGVGSNGSWSEDRIKSPVA